VRGEATQKTHICALGLLCPLRTGPFAGRVFRRRGPWLGEEGTPAAEICRKAGISQATYFNWKKKYAGLMPSEMQRLRELEDENSRLKKIVADLTLDREMLQDVIKRKL
jgi:putative transposase